MNTAGETETINAGTAEARPVLLSAGWQLLLLVALGAALGAWLAALAIPAWLPEMAASLLGPDAKAFWLLSRASALSAYLLLWLSMALGLGISNKMARLWPGALAAFDLHQFISLLGLGFALFHALILTGDRYINYNLVQIALPFASVGYKPLAVGLGQLAFYLSALVTGSFYFRRQIGQQAWRLIHFASFAVFLLALLHGIASGTDSGTAWAAGMYWLSGGSLLFLLVYRMLQRK